MKPVRLSCGCGLYNDIMLSFVEMLDIGQQSFSSASVNGSC